MSLSQESNSSSEGIGTPTLDELKKFFVKQKRLANIKYLESTTTNQPECMNETLQIYLKQRNERLLQEKEKIERLEKFNILESPKRLRVFNDTLSQTAHEDSWTDDSFLEQEKLCMQQSIPLIDFNESAEVVDDSEENDVIENMLKEYNDKGTPKVKSTLPLPQINDTTLLADIEAPSFMFSNTTIMQSPISSKLPANRPSTIAEESTLMDSVISTSKNLSSDSFQTAFTRNYSEISENYKTATEDDSQRSESIIDSFKRPKTRPFFTDNLNTSAVYSFEADSLMKTRVKDENMTRDSLEENNDSTIEISSESETSGGNVSNIQDESQVILDESDLEELDTPTGEPNFNDTLEKFEYMMNQAMKLNGKSEDAVKDPSPAKKHPLTPKTPSIAKKPAISEKSTSATKPLVPKVFSKLAISTARSPAAKSQPSIPTFKKPQAANSSKIPQISANKQFSHIVSPLSQYIRSTPVVPLATNVHLQRKSGAITKLFSHRDSEVSFKENLNMNKTIEDHKVPSLPCRAKATASTAQVIDKRTPMKVPGGEGMKKLLVNTSPTVIRHEARIRGLPRPKVFSNISMTSNDSRLSEQSFGDLSMMSGDVSVHIVKDAKRH